MTERGSGGPGDMSSASNSLGTPKRSAAAKAMLRLPISSAFLSVSHGMSEGRKE